jgi:hypothetical protein
MHLPPLDGSLMANPGVFIQDLDRADEDLDAALEKTDPRLLQPSAVPEEFRILLTPIDYKILDLWSRGVATRKISKAMKEAGEECVIPRDVKIHNLFLHNHFIIFEPSL